MASVSRRAPRSLSRVGAAVLAAGVLAFVGPADAQQRPRRPRRQPPAAATTTTPAAGSTTAPGATPPAAQAPIRPVPLGAGETAGSRVARARALMEELEFSQVVGLLMPLRQLRDINPALGIEAALLETAALIAEQRVPMAVDACKHAVALAGYNPDVAREQSPLVQGVCRTAAEQARRELIESRHIRITSVTATTAPVAHNPVRVEARFEGELGDLATQAEVVSGTSAPVTVNLTSAEGARVALLDASHATPGAELQVTPLVRDRYGVLLRAAAPTLVRIPTAESAVRFAPGSDEGALSVDGRPAGARVTVGGVVPLPLGRHELSVRANDGHVSTARVDLQSGEVALVTLHSEAVSSLPDVLRWSSTGLAVVSLLAGAGLQVFAVSSASSLRSFADQRDPVTQLPLVRYGDVEGYEQNRQLAQNTAIGCFIAAGVFGTVAVIAWSIPRGPRTESSPRGGARGPQVSVTPGLTGGSFTVTF